jgi:hypothetical protein
MALLLSSLIADLCTEMVKHYKIILKKCHPSHKVSIWLLMDGYIRVERQLVNVSSLKWPEKWSILKMSIHN